jgi:phosphonate C-P lyase system protein PhnG
MEKLLNELSQDPMDINSALPHEIEEGLPSILSGMAAAEMEALTDILGSVPVRIVRGPETGVIMARACDCFDVEFCLGEVLVTTTEVDCDGIRGHATILGDEPMKSVIAATASAILKSTHQDCICDIRRFVEKYMKKVMEICHKEALLTAATRVRFDSMSEEAWT